MGPRQLRRGDAGTGRQRRTGRRGFNGAAAITPRRSKADYEWFPGVAALQWGRGNYAAEIESASRRQARSEELQWGRGNYAAEITRAARDPSPTNCASMGPRQLRRGDPLRRAMERAGVSMLQWGRGNYAAE